MVACYTNFADGIGKFSVWSEQAFLHTWYGMSSLYTCVKEPKVMEKKNDFIGKVELNCKMLRFF